MPQRVAVSALILALACSGNPSSAAEFDRLGGEVIASLLRDPKTRAHQALAFRDLEALPPILGDTRASLLLARTDQGNLARLLVAPAFRKRPTPGDGAAEPRKSRGELVPILLVERFDVFDGGHPSSRVSQGQDLMLFPGFQLDLDSGQVVPEGMGGDLQFSAVDSEDGRLSPLGPARLATLEKRPPLPSPTALQTTDAKPVGPADLAGRFRLVADGRWTRLLQLSVDASGAVTGRFRSDSSGSDYPVTGKVDSNAPSKIQFIIQFPRSRQDFAGNLWSAGKQVISGSGSMQNREFGFVAVREGATLNVSDEPGSKVGRSPAGAKPGTTWLRIRVDPTSDRFQVGKEFRAGPELTEALLAALRADPNTGIVVTASGSVSYSRLQQIVHAARAAGVASIRLASEVDEP
jgi:biopolymer transport protein ExbD